ncbi:MAG: hypothetical protein QM535_13950, partial [Limnohabitans sp.]|nr:hypothetical protein [Limnohabitans sp.]
DKTGVLDLLDITDQKKIYCTGTYMYKKKGVITFLIINQEFNSTVFKIDDTANNYSFNTPSLSTLNSEYNPRWYDVLSEDENGFELNYDPNFNKNRKTIKDIDLFLNGQTIKIFSDKNSSSYILDSDKYGISFNKEKGTTICGKMKNKQVLFTLLKKDKNVYLFITSFKNGKKFDVKEAENFLKNQLKFKNYSPTQN